VDFLAMEHSEITVAAILARPAKVEHEGNGRRVYHYDLDPRFDPQDWKIALLDVAIARAAGSES
jgi:hypothetical protein